MLSVYLWSTYRSKKNDEQMDVDNEGGENEGNDTEVDEPSMSVDEEGNETSPKKKRSKLGPRKSQLDVAALSNEQEALAALESNEILHLRLRKKYYAEALNFIRQIEGAMETMCKLLGSTNKPEVLEAMEFFRVAHEYKFESAMVCSRFFGSVCCCIYTLQMGIKKMLHLIWSKDNTSSTEDGKEVKGVRSRLLECYRNLYFEVVPDMSPKEQVNRITKNMVEYVFHFHFDAFD
jgi:condensin complex subunit 1